MKRPEEILADWRGDAAVLRTRGHGHDADILESCADAMGEAIKPFLAWVSEPDAMLRSGKGTDYFRSRFAAWVSQGLAEGRGRRRWYRAAVIPLRAHPSAARLQGLRGERAS